MRQTTQEQISASAPNRFFYRVTLGKIYGISELARRNYLKCVRQPCFELRGAAVMAYIRTCEVLLHLSSVLLFWTAAGAGPCGQAHRDTSDGWRSPVPWGDNNPGRGRVPHPPAIALQLCHQVPFFACDWAAEGRKSRCFSGGCFASRRTGQLKIVSPCCDVGL